MAGNASTVKCTVQVQKKDSALTVVGKTNDPILHGHTNGLKKADRLMKPFKGKSLISEYIFRMLKAMDSPMDAIHRQ